MAENSDNSRNHQKKVMAMASDFTSLIQEMCEQMEELKIEINLLKTERNMLANEDSIKDSEIRSLQMEIQSLNEKEEMRMKEVLEVRQENERLIQRLKIRDSVAEQGLQFAKAVLQNSSNGIVNSMPEFSKQFALSERPNSMSAMTGSLAQVNGMRLMASHSIEEDSYHSIRTASNQLTTSDETYYDACPSQRSSITNGSNSVRPKACQQNQVSSTVHFETESSGHIEDILSMTATNSSSYGFDENNNLKLKLVRVPVGKLSSVNIAYIRTPSDFWLHLNSTNVSNYIHVIQVKQNELLKICSKLSSADITLGMYVAAVYSADGYWYRAQVINIVYDDPNECDSIKLVRVLYIDWGNTEDLPLAMIMKLSTELSKRRQAIHCYLQGYIEYQKWPQSSIDEFKEFVENNKLNAHFNKCHKLDERLDSVIYPVELTVTLSEEKIENMINLLPIPELCEEGTEIFETLNIQTNRNASNGLSDQTLGSPEEDKKKKKKEKKTKQLSTEYKAHSNQNCSTNYIKCNGNSEVPKIIPKSMPHLNLVSDSALPLRIPAPIIPETTEGLIAQVSSFSNPSHFYLQIQDHVVGSAQFEDLEEQLNHYYSTYVPTHRTLPSEVTVGSFWSSFWGNEDKVWYRVRVIQVIGLKVLVNYVDYGNEELVEIKHLMPLSLRFAIYPAMAVKCRLSKVFPNSDDNKWSHDGSQFFSELVIERPVTAYIVDKPIEFDFDSALEVFLWTNDSERDILINYHLFKLKFAKTDDNVWVKEAEKGERERTPPQVMSELIPKITNSTNYSEPKGQQMIEPNTSSAPPLVNNHSNIKRMPELPNGYSDEDDEDWDPMAEDAFGDRNTYNAKIDDIGYATLGYRINEQKTCKYFGTAKGCRLKDFCTFLHVDPNKRYEMNNTEEVLLNILDLDLEVNSFVAMKVTSIVTPFSFYGILPFGTQSVSESQITSMVENQEHNKLSNALKDKYSKLNAKSVENQNILHGIGSLVAYKDVNDDYFRGRVVASDPDTNNFTIFSIDYGTEVEIQRKFIYGLTPYFCQIPALAVHCSLTGLEPSNGDKRWSEMAIDVFKDMTLNQILCANIIFGRTEDKLYVELIHTFHDQRYLISEQLIDANLAQKSQNNSVVNHSQEEDNYSDLD